MEAKVIDREAWVWIEQKESNGISLTGFLEHCSDIV